MAAALQQVDSSSRAEVEVSGAEVVEVHFGFEVRACRPSIQVRTVVRGGYRENLGDAFRILAGYLYGGNRTPDGTSVDVACTGPIAHVDRGAVSVVAVTVEGAWALEELPKPLDPRVTLAPAAGGRFAVLPFTGRATAETVDMRKRELLQLVLAAGLEPIGELSVVQLDSPWVLSASRRNEIRVPVA